MTIDAGGTGRPRRWPVHLGFALAALIAGVGCEEILSEDAGVGTDLGARPDAGLPADTPCAEVPFAGGTVTASLEVEAGLARADVLFLVDRTRSMEGELEQIRDRLRDDIAPGIREAVSDSQLSVATVGDFPAGNCGETIDEPFEMTLASTDDLTAAQAAVDNVRLGNGLDQPEAQVEALYQIATGVGLRPYIDPAPGCSGDAVGYPCFRPDAVPVILLFTDAAFHNGPGDANPYREACPQVLDDAERSPAAYAQAVDALGAIGARVVGLSSGEGGQATEHLRAIVADTGGDPDELFFEIGPQGERLSDAVVDALATLADRLEVDVDTVLRDPDPGDGIDPRDLVERVLAIRADPPSQVDSIDLLAGRFLGVQVGTRVFVEVELNNDVIQPGPTPQSVVLQVLFRGDERYLLGSALLQLVIPAEDGAGCEVQ